MIDFSNIKEYTIEPPDGWNLLGAKEEFDALSDEFKDQILFLNEESSNFLYDYLKVSKLHTGPLWSPFEKKNFKFIEQISLEEDEAIIKKWLYNRGIPFSKWVYVLPNYDKGGCLTMTWKMVIKNCSNLFFSDDIVIFDETNQWCLTYWHEDEMFFGKINITSHEMGYKEVTEMNEKEKKYPGYKHPLKD